MSSINGTFAYQDRRDQLKPYVGQEVEARGVYGGPGDTFRKTGYPTNNTAIVRQLFVTTSTGQTLDIEHCWVQYADTIREQARTGEAVRFRATVGTYQKEEPTDDGQGVRTRLTYNLTRPAEVVFPDRTEEPEGAVMAEPPAVPEPTPQPEPRPALSAVQQIRAVRRLAEQVGGWNELRELIAELEQ